MDSRSYFLKLNRKMYLAIDKYMDEDGNFKEVSLNEVLHEGIAISDVDLSILKKALTLGMSLAYVISSDHGDTKGAHLKYTPSEYCKWKSMVELKEMKIEEPENSNLHVDARRLKYAIRKSGRLFGAHNREIAPEQVDQLGMDISMLHPLEGLSDIILNARELINSYSISTTSKRIYNKITDYNLIYNKKDKKSYLKFNGDFKEIYINKSFNSSSDRINTLDAF